MAALLDMAQKTPSAAVRNVMDRHPRDSSNTGGNIHRAVDIHHRSEIEKNTAQTRKELSMNNDDLSWIALIISIISAATAVLSLLARML